MVIIKPILSSAVYNSELGAQIFINFKLIVFNTLPFWYLNNKLDPSLNDRSPISFAGGITNDVAISFFSGTMNLLIKCIVF